MKKKLDMKKYLGKESEFVLNLGVMADFEGKTGQSFFQGFDMGKMKVNDLLVLIFLGVKAAGYDITMDDVRGIDIELIEDFTAELTTYIGVGKKGGDTPLAKKQQKK